MKANQITLKTRPFYLHVDYLAIAIWNPTDQNMEVGDMTLMDCIQQYTVLYDKCKKDYNDQRKKENTWREVSAKLGIAEVEAQTRYKTIRTKFSKNIEGMRGKSGSEATNID